MSSLRIAILGAGDIGGTLGRKWARAGHITAFGVKNPASEKAQSLREELGEQLIAEFGLRPMRLGDLDQIEVVDEILRLWGTLALFQGMGRNNVAFKVLNR